MTLKRISTDDDISDVIALGDRGRCVGLDEPTMLLGAYIRRTHGVKRPDRLIQPR